MVQLARRSCAIAGLVLSWSLMQSEPALGDGSWIESMPGSWNTPGTSVPQAPAGNAQQLAQCAEQVRPASTAADRALEAAGWKLFGPVTSYGETAAIRAMTNADSMCRPLGYQVFLFVGDTFAGTFSPAPMDSRTDGALSDVQWLDGSSANATFQRYDADDALCCASRQSTVVYAIEQRDGRPVLAALSAQTVELAPPPEPPAPPPPIWTGSLGAGLSLTDGNTDTSSYNLAFEAVRDPKTLWIFRADGLYLRTEQDGDDTADRTVLHVREERSLSERMFLFADVGYLRDKFKAIDYLVSPSVGAGWKAILPEPVSLIFDAGVGVAIEKNPGRDSTSDAAFNIGEAFDWNFSERARLTQNARGLWKFEDTEDAIYHFDIGVAASLSEAMELKVAYLIDYDNLPTSPELDKTDTALLATVVLKF